MSDHPSKTNPCHQFSRRKKLLFLALIWAGLFIAGEGSMRAWMSITGRDIAAMKYDYDWRRTKRLKRMWAFQDRTYPYLPYVPRVKPPNVDMLGLRLTSPEEVKPPDVFRVFCLGGSTTYAGYPAKLEKELADDFAQRGLRLEVVNAADVSWTTVETFINFSVRCLYYQPDAIIVYHAQNDAWPAFGESWRHDYTHWRKQLIENAPLWSDYLPRLLDHSALYVQLRAGYESQVNTIRWVDTMTRYVPDFFVDPYHGAETYRSNITNLIAVARAHGVQVLLSTQIVNEEVPEQRLVAAVQGINEITRSFSDYGDGVTVVDPVPVIPGSHELMRDICHFKFDGVGEGMLVDFFAATIRDQLDVWLQPRLASAKGRRPEKDAL